MTPKQYMKDDNYMVRFKDRVSFVDKKQSLSLLYILHY